jgi:uncharacterized membrane-anchored protein YhcB (DUF1043 family)
MAELITIIIDIALGALAYRLAYENRAQIEALATRVEKLEQYVANRDN